MQRRQLPSQPYLSQHRIHQDMPQTHNKRERVLPTGSAEPTDHTLTRHTHMPANPIGTEGNLPQHHSVCVCVCLPFSIEATANTPRIVSVTPQIPRPEAAAQRCSLHTRLSKQRALRHE
ncbi:hypothetical protein DQ04_02641080 [Trypanosoma grayi]|uniref:hypothetical protein n=1 Tax=Trypanosoma grayi TaxID=71804 RepID=UPI0004F4170A|nr:hypothetical protein DQ04_02641080 [Trypanosoma grayi]KEG11421.1 hypothetical protein DQ04_02641080 [Trypanosoma grayi]